MDIRHANTFITISCQYKRRAGYWGQRSVGQCTMRSAIPVDGYRETERRGEGRESSPVTLLGKCFLPSACRSTLREKGKWRRRGIKQNWPESHYNNIDFHHLWEHFQYHRLCVSSWWITFKVWKRSQEPADSPLYLAYFVANVIHTFTSVKFKSWNLHNPEMWYMEYLMPSKGFYGALCIRTLGRWGIPRSLLHRVTLMENAAALIDLLICFYFLPRIPWTCLRAVDRI